jgi:serine/threonine protein kinase
LLRIKKINHLDIKPQNILLVETADNLNIKLSDFGISYLVLEKLINSYLSLMLSHDAADIDVLLVDHLG